ncbi:MAG TPA: GNAT family N-acetyltransferase [Oscillospiraceae bacterium]|nr:GNAT family N-acetyltransferase [Oscillospiraceae bacterium]
MLKLNKFTNQDIKLFTEWLNKDYIKKWYTDTDEWLEEVLSDKFEFIHHFIAADDNKPFGFCQYYDYSLGDENWHGAIDIKDTFSIDYLIGEKEYLGKGFGTKIIKLLTEKVFEETIASQIIVQPEKDNAASRNTLLSAGYGYDEGNDIFIFKRSL